MERRTCKSVLPIVATQSHCPIM